MVATFQIAKYLSDRQFYPWHLVCLFLLLNNLTWRLGVKAHVMHG